MRRRVALGAVAVAAVLLGVAALATEVEQEGRVACAVAGFALAAGGLMELRARMAAAIAFILTFYGGVSAAAAVHRPAVETTADLTAAPALDALGIAHWFPPRLAGPAFDAAMHWLVAFGAVAMVAAVVVERHGRPRMAVATAASRPDPLLRTVALALTAVGGLGLALMLLRYAANVAQGASFWRAGRELWNGSAYMIFTAHLAIPGLGALLAYDLDAGRGRARWWGGGLAGVALLSIPTGQRGFAIEIALTALAVLASRRAISARQLIAVGTIGLAGLVVTQAVRDLARTRNVNRHTVAGAFSTKESVRRLENQFASFQWAVDVSANERHLRETVSPERILLKPVPRQVLASKPGGLAEEFTIHVYPWTATAGVTLAIPLYAELHVYGGWVALLLGALLLGALGGAGMALAAASPRAVRPLLHVGALWTVLVLFRGDLFNSIPVAASWIAPLALLVLAARGAGSPALAPLRARWTRRARPGPA